MIGESEGFTLRYVGLLGRLAGKYPRAALIAANTSRAAALMSRLRSNWRMMPVDPRVLDEVISDTPAIRPNCRSKGVATEDAMVSGLAPGSAAETEIVGKSTCGRGETGNRVNAAMPESAIAMVSKVVATGLRMKIAETFMAALRRDAIPAPIAPEPPASPGNGKTGRPGGRRKD